MGNTKDTKEEPNGKDPVEEQEQVNDNNDFEKNPDIEVPRLYSPYLGASSPAHKDRSSEEEPNQTEEKEGETTSQNEDGTNSQKEEQAENS